MDESQKKSSATVDLIQIFESCRGVRTFGGGLKLQGVDSFGLNAKQASVWGISQKARTDGGSNKRGEQIKRKRG